MKLISKFAVIGVSLILSACAGQSMEKEFAELCTPIMQEAQEVELAEAEMFCGCAGDVFKEHATKAEFETINEIFRTSGADAKIEKELRTKLGEDRYREIGDHIDKCDA